MGGVFWGCWFAGELLLFGEEENLDDMLENHELRREGGVPLGPDFSFDGLLPIGGRDIGIGLEASVVPLAASGEPLALPLGAGWLVVGEAGVGDSRGVEVEGRRAVEGFETLSVSRIMD